jgi:membrane-bound serine protease (ClpP class)
VTSLRRPLVVSAGFVLAAIGVGSAASAGASSARFAVAASHGATHHLSASPTLAFVLFVLGLAGMCFELTHPGLNVPGLAGLISFIVSLVLLGRLPVDAAGVILLVLAFVFFIIELRIGTHSVLGLAGVACLVLGGLFLYDPSVPNARVAIPLLIAISVLLGGFFLFVARMALKTRNTPVVTGADTLIGEEGIVTHELHPAGQVRVRGEVWAATLDDSTATVPIGAKVVVSDLRGLTLYVAPVNQTAVRPMPIRPPGGNDS